MPQLRNSIQVLVALVGLLYCVVPSSGGTTGTGFFKISLSNKQRPSYLRGEQVLLHVAVANPTDRSLVYLGLGETFIDGVRFAVLSVGHRVRRQEDAPVLPPAPLDESLVRQLPEGGILVSLNVDGYDLPSDWYLRLGGATGRMLRGEIALTAEIPLPFPP